jgi:putative ABC transport system permease protein
MAILVGPRARRAEIEQEVLTALRTATAVHPDDLQAYGSFNRQKEFRKINNLFLGISGLTWIVGVLTMLAGAIGVSNIMMIAVAERTRRSASARPSAPRPSRSWFRS